MERADTIIHGSTDTLEDWRDALRLYEQAATLGSARALCRLGNMYRSGDGPKRNIDKGMDLLKKAGQMGSYSALASLCDQYLVERDYKSMNRVLRVFEQYTIQQLQGVPKRPLDWEDGYAVAQMMSLFLRFGRDYDAQVFQPYSQAMIQSLDQATVLCLREGKHVVADLPVVTLAVLPVISLWMLELGREAIDQAVNFANIFSVYRDRFKV